MGTRFGPERYLAPRESGFSLPGTRIVTDKPGVTYWRKDRDPAAAQRMAELLDWPGRTPRSAGSRPSLCVARPTTLAVPRAARRQRWEGEVPSAKSFAASARSTSRPCHTPIVAPCRATPVITTMIRLPAEWRGRELQASYVTPEMQVGALPVPIAVDAAIVDPQRGTLRLRTPAFETCLIVFLRSPAEQRGEARR
jgi:hypothetical protein